MSNLNYNEKILKIWPLIFCFINCVSCSSRPVLYPNHKLKRVGVEQSQQDIDHCLAEAEKYLTSKKGQQILKSAGKGATFGSALGLVTGLFTGDVLQGVAQGAALGGTAGAIGESISPDQLKRNYVHHCLQKQHYQIIGWD